MLSRQPVQSVFLTVLRARPLGVWIAAKAINVRSRKHTVQRCSPPSAIASMGTCVLPRGYSLSGRETDRTFPSSAELKNEWIYTPTSPYAFILQAVCVW